jgi:hypothetical protein
MTEADIINQYNLITDRVYVILQWWASISFALVALSHFAAKKLSLALTLTVGALYVLLTCYVLGAFYRNATFLLSLQDDLSEIHATGAGSNIADAIVRPLNPLVGMSIGLSIVGLFFGSLGYLTFSYRKARARS